eukprot:SAG11_NODE_5472_length_1551_cov_0.802342_2_plen_146_part_01
MAPSSLTVAGLSCHSDANGEYSVAADTIGGKPHWLLEPAAGDQTFHLYAVNEPHDGWAIGGDLSSYIAFVESYERLPPWGTHTWREVCGADGSVEQRQLSATPGYSAQDCAEALELMAPQLTESCGSAEGGPTFGELLAQGEAPTV